MTIISNISTVNISSGAFDVKFYLSKFTPGTNHEALPHGASTSHNWYYHSLGEPRILVDPNHYMNWWGIIYHDLTNAHPPNTRVAVKNVKFLLKYSDESSWRTVQDMIGGTGGSGYPENWDNRPNTPIDMRTESDGSISFVPRLTYTSHFWTKEPLVNVRTGILTHAIVVFHTKLILANPSGTDDRDGAKYITGSGADYRESNYYCPNGVCPGIGLGKFIYARKYWRTAVMSTMSLTDLNTLPMPPKELFLMPDGKYPS